MNVRINKTLRRKGIRKPDIPTSIPKLQTQIQTPEETLQPPDLNPPEMARIKPHPNWVKM
jgi:hypothetical protein